MLERTLHSGDGQRVQTTGSSGADKGEYDFIIVDTPPALGILTINALTACDSVIIPAQADIYSLQGVEQLAETIKPVKKYTNPTLTIEAYF